MEGTEQILAVSGLWIAALILLVQQCGFPIPIPTFFILFAVGFATARGFYALPLAFVIMLVVCRFASPIARPRSEPAAEFAPLSHMLMKGFFFNHGLVMSVLLWVAKPEGQEALTVAA